MVPQLRSRFRLSAIDAIAAIRPCSRDNRMAGDDLFHVQVQLENARKLMPMHLLQMPGPGLVSVRKTEDGGIAIDIEKPTMAEHMRAALEEVKAYHEPEPSDRERSARNGALQALKSLAERLGIPDPFSQPEGATGASTTTHGPTRAYSGRHA